MCFFQYNINILALNISWYRYQSDISMPQMMHTFIIYFVVWNVRKAASCDFTQISL